MKGHWDPLGKESHIPMMNVIWELCTQETTIVVLGVKYLIKNVFLKYTLLFFVCLVFSLIPSLAM